MTTPQINRELAKVQKNVKQYWVKHNKSRAAFLKFLRAYDIRFIPKRPREGETICDNNQKEIIDGKDWDKFYGRFKFFVNNEEKLRECLEEVWK